MIVQGDVNFHVSAGVPLSTCDKDVGLLLGARPQELHGVGVVHLPQHLNLRAKIPESNGAAALQDLCRHQGPMEGCLVHDPKLPLACGHAPLSSCPAQRHPRSTAEYLLELTAWSRRREQQGYFEYHQHIHSPTPLLHPICSRSSCTAAPQRIKMLHRKVKAAGIPWKLRQPGVSALILSILQP